MTVIGLCCGLELYVVGVLATVFGWGLTFALESRGMGRLVVMGLEREAVAAAATGYARVLEGAGCTIVGEEKSVLKGRVALVYRGPAALDRATLEAQFQRLGDRERGNAIDWESL